MIIFGEASHKKSQKTLNILTFKKSLQTTCQELYAQYCQYCRNRAAQQVFFELI